jgi:putative lipoic acid-binding regulatory protein
MPDKKDKQQDKTNLIKFEQESKVLEKAQPNLDSMASHIQEELFKSAEDINNSTFLIGSTLLEIQRSELYKQGGYTNFTAWLVEFSKKAKGKKTKLWDSKKIVKMLEDTATPFSEVSHTSTKGLYQIARIHKKANDHDQTKKLIEQLSNKEITVTKLKELAKDITKPSEKKAHPEPIDDKKSPCINKVYQRVFISLLPILIVFFYITDIS